MKSCDTKRPGQQQIARTMMSHLAYQPLLPSGSKYLQQKWDKASYDLHRRKVKSAQPTINVTPPKTFGHLALRMKKQKLEEEWTMKIQRENNMLMEKISHIMRTTGGVDNRNDYDRKSLGKEKRQLEFLRITKENQMILFRLSQCRPHYNVQIWHEDWLKTLKVMDSIARYPRGRSTQQKGQEKPINKHRDCHKEVKISTDDTTHSPATSKAKGKAEPEKNKKKTETSKADDAGNPEKSIPPDTKGNPGASNTIQITEDKPPHTDDTSSSPGGHNPHTQKTTEQETTCPTEG